MALIVEGGTGLANAESFVSVADADTFHSNRGNTAWAALTTAVKEQSLRKATDYMEQAFRMRWNGYRRTDTQALSWPRYEVPRPDSAANASYGYGFGYYDFDVVPTEVKNACADLANKASTETLAPDLGVPVTSKTVGPISITYAAGVRQYKIFRAAENLLAPLLKSSGSMISVVRA